MDNPSPLKLGLRSLPISQWLDLEHDLADYLRQKEQLFTDRYEDVIATLPTSQEAQQEVLDMVQNHLLVQFSDIYTQTDTCWRNQVTGQTWDLRHFGDRPLELAARMIPEDLCVLMPGDNGYVLAAAAVCFPLAWSIREKLGKPLGQIHAPVPGYAQSLERPVDNVFAKLRPDYPGYRFNWSLVNSPTLFLRERSREALPPEQMTLDRVGHHLWVRVERQTLRRLPHSDGILFTIRTYLYSIASLQQTEGAIAALAQAIQHLSPEQRSYKNIEPYHAVLMAYLTSH